MPALRYRTGDLVRVPSSACGCGSPFVCFPGGLLGRADDMIQVRGVNVYPSAVENIIRENQAVVEFSVDVFREREMWEMVVRVEFAPGLLAEQAAELTQALSQQIETKLGLRAQVQLAEPGSLPRYELKAKRFQIRR